MSYLEMVRRTESTAGVDMRFKSPCGNRPKLSRVNENLMGQIATIALGVDPALFNRGIRTRALRKGKAK